MGTKKGRICGKGAPFKEAAPQRFAGGSYTKLPPPLDPPLLRLFNAAVMKPFGSWITSTFTASWRMSLVVRTLRKLFIWLIC